MVIDAFNHIYPKEYLEASYLYKEMAERHRRARREVERRLGWV
jgi:hypothetical protein